MSHGQTNLAECIGILKLLEVPSCATATEKVPFSFTIAIIVQGGSSPNRDPSPTQGGLDEWLGAARATPRTGECGAAKLRSAAGLRWRNCGLLRRRIVKNGRLQKLQMSLASSLSRDLAPPTAGRQRRGFVSRDDDTPPATSRSTSYVCCPCVTSPSDHAHCSDSRTVCNQSFTECTSRHVAPLRDDLSVTSQQQQFRL